MQQLNRTIGPKYRHIAMPSFTGPTACCPNYDQLWDNSQENTAESIFEINYDGGSTNGNWGAKMFRGIDWKKFNIPSNDLVTAFEAEQDEIRKNSSIVWEDVSGKWSDPHWPQPIILSSTNGVISRKAAIRTISSSALLISFYLRPKR